MEFRSLVQLTEYFSDKQVCIDYLTQLRWGGNVTCTFCQHDKVYELKGENKRFKCAKCRKQFSSVKGTVLKYPTLQKSDFTANPFGEFIEAD